MPAGLSAEQMEKNGANRLEVGNEGLVVCQNSHGAEVAGTLLRLTRYQVVFEIYTPDTVLQTSEVLAGFKVTVNERVIYSGRAVVANLLNTGTAFVCEARLDEPWLEADPQLALRRPEQWRDGFGEFVRQWQRLYKIQPEYKSSVADLQTFLTDLRLWLSQAELEVLSQPADRRTAFERAIVQSLAEPVVPALGALFEKFEDSCRNLPPDLQPAHQAYVRRQLHPLVLCAPFMNRTYQKPLGYAGDYEMVSMMVRDPQEGQSVFAKLLNTFFLNTPPVVAHRNRLEYLNSVLTQEAARARRSRRELKIFNLGCGPAKEIQTFIATSDLSARARFTLLDFNQETVAHTGEVLNKVIRESRRAVSLQMVKKSVAQLLKESARQRSTSFPTDYDLVYCAGLFDYLPDSVCTGLMSVLYSLVSPGGLLVATNVHTSNPSRNWMEYSVDWHLVYRDRKQMVKLAPAAAPQDSYTILSEPSGVNTFIEVRKPEHD
jgi:extracellular factor (EF) 3-hydroxypalmitic acid methyl ester biosynthesis protein